MKKFFILCPPPNVTGELHIGHALTFAIQNAFARANQVIGKKDSFLIPGYDHGGISTFYMAQKEGAKTFEDVKCFAEKSKSLIKEQFKQLKLLSRDEYEEYTMGPDHYQLVQETFVKLYDKKLITKEKYIINYDTILKTVISDMEINMEERNGKLYVVKYELSNNEFISVATTRPETIFADVALAVNPEDERYTHLIGKFATIPIINRRIPIIAEDSVSKNFGTGVLKITPDHSSVDFALGKKHNLPMINIMGIKEVTNSQGVKEWIFGLNLKDDNLARYSGNPEDVRNLIAQDLNLEFTNIKQSVPVSGKSGSVVECFLQDQWFLNVKDAAEKALTMNLNIQPEIWKNNYITWMKNINEKWCISRQIPWGHRIPVWYAVNEDNSVDYKTYKVCIKCPGEKWTMCTDVLDTWFSSALWPILYKNKYNLFPSSLLVTAYDILFFWVARMVLMSLILTNELPFEAVFIHDLVRDSQGHKMSKTRGNGINPTRIIEEEKEYGGYDVLSYALISKVVPNGNIKFGEDCVNRARSIIIKVKNAVKLYLLKLNDSNVQCKDIEEYFLAYAYDVYKEYEGHLKDLAIHKMLEIATNYLYFICDYLVEFTKVDNTLIFALQQSLQTVLILLFPFIPENCETLWKSITNENMLPFVPKFRAMNSTENNLIKLIKKIRSLSSLKILISNENENVNIIKHMCHIQSIDGHNCQLFGYKLYIENIFLLNDEIYKIDDRMNTINLFFQRSQRDKVPDHVWIEREKTYELLSLQKEELDTLIKSSQKTESPSTFATVITVIALIYMVAYSTWGLIIETPRTEEHLFNKYDLVKLK